MISGYALLLNGPALEAIGFEPATPDEAWTAPVAAGTRLGRLRLDPAIWSGVAIPDSGVVFSPVVLDDELHLVARCELAAGTYADRLVLWPGGLAIVITIAVEADEVIPPDPEEPPVEPVGDNLLVVTNNSVAAIDWPFGFARPFAPGEIAHEPRLLIDGYEAASDTNVLARWPDGSAKHARFAVVLAGLAAGVSVEIGFCDKNPPAGRRHRRRPARSLLDDFPDFDAVLAFDPPDGEVQRVSARAMLEAGDYQLVYPGTVAQTLMFGDDSAARKYDIGFAAQHGEARPLRPRFYATFWMQTGQVELRAVVESSLTAELADSLYVASLSLGHAAPAEVWRLDLSGSKKHWTMTSWTKRVWLGAAPAAEVAIDWGIEYLVGCGALPSYDLTLDVLPTVPARAAGEPYDGSWNGLGILQSAMGTGGARGEIAPFPQWHVQALYPRADHLIRDYMLAVADQAASFPCHLRETVPGKRLARDDPPGDSGLGRAISITDRPTICLSQPTYSYTKPEDRVAFVGGTRPPNGPWTFDGAHQPQYFFVPYLVTGDPWYLDELYLWAGFSAGWYNGAATDCSGRGPNGSYGGINDQLRGAGWVARCRCETAWIAPDADPEKDHLITLAHDALARWEGSQGVALTPYAEHACHPWGASTGNYHSANNGPCAKQPLPLGNWESNGYPDGKNATIANNVNIGIYALQADGRPVAGSFTAPWMEWYKDYGLARCAQLGFPAGPLFVKTVKFLIGVICDSGYPKLVSMYQMPTEKNALPPGDPPPKLAVPPGGMFIDWPDMLTAIEPGYLSGDGFAGPPENGPLDSYFAGKLVPDGYPMLALASVAAACDCGLPDAAAAWDWLNQNGYQQVPIEQLRTAPAWAIVPRPTPLALPPIAWTAE